MDKKTISYLFIGIFSAILLLGVVFGIKVFNDSKQISQGDSLMAMEKYKEASLVYEGILRKGYREDVSKKMDRAQELMESKKNYEQGLKLWDDEKYKDAIKFLSKVSKNDKERYLTTVQKINEIEESLLSEIQEVIDQGDLDSGMDMLNDYLKIMPKSETAKNMKQDINFQRSQEKAEYERQVEEEKNQEMEEEKNMKVWSQATYAVGTTQTIVSKEANLRVAPRLNADVLTTLAQGTECYIIDTKIENNERFWCQVEAYDEYGEYYTGWVSYNTMNYKY